MTIAPKPTLTELQRHVADDMVAAIRKATQSLAKGKSDPLDAYCWDNATAFEMYIDLSKALLAAERARLGQGRYFEPTCATCLNWKRYRADRADVAPEEFSQERTVTVEEATIAAEMGVCTANAPTRQHLPALKPAGSMVHFPRTQKDWVCGQWQTATSRRGYVS